MSRYPLLEKVRRGTNNHIWNSVNGRFQTGDLGPNFGPQDHAAFWSFPRYQVTERWESPHGWGFSVVASCDTQDAADYLAWLLNASTAERLTDKDVEPF